MANSQAHTVFQILGTLSVLSTQVTQCQGGSTPKLDPSGFRSNHPLPGTYPKSSSVKTSEIKQPLSKYKYQYS